MAFIHGRNTVVMLGATDLSVFTDNVAFNQSADSHQTTTFGRNSHTFQGGLKNGTSTLTGTYDDGVAGPEAIINPMIGTTVVFVYKPEGAGSGKPTRTVSVVVTGYEETSPVADMVKWSATLQHTGDVVNTVGP